MKYILYKYKEKDKGGEHLYVTKINGKKIHCTTFNQDAKRFTFIQAIILSLRYKLTWMPEKYIQKL